MAIEVRAVEDMASAADVLEQLRTKVYADDRDFCRPSLQSVLAELSRPGFRQRFFVAATHGEVRACTLARVSPHLLDDNRHPYGMLGKFEAEDDLQPVATLFSHTCAWLSEQGVEHVLGPIDGDTWHSYRLNVGPWNEPPFLFEPYNPAYYPDLWLACRFHVVEEYHSKQVDAAAAFPVLSPKLERVLAQGYRLDRLRVERFDEELERIYEMSRVLFRDNPLYTEISSEDFSALYRGVRDWVEPDCVRIAVAPDGSDAGFAFAVPDWHAAMTAMRGETGSEALERFLKKREAALALNLKTLGVMAEHRRTGLGGALTATVYEAAIERGLPFVNLCLMHDENFSSRLDGDAARVLRRYRLYRRRVAGGDV